MSSLGAMLACSRTGPHPRYTLDGVTRNVQAGDGLRCIAAIPRRGSLTKPFAHNAINTALKTALQGQDIPAFTIHDLRRTASTLLHENGWL